MLNNIIKPTKIYSINSSDISLKSSLGDLQKELQTLKSEIVTVRSTSDKGDVIFTTPSGKSYSLNSNFRVSPGDKVRVEFKENNTLEIVSIFEKTLPHAMQNQNLPFPDNGIRLYGQYMLNSDTSLKPGKKISCIFLNCEFEEDMGSSNGLIFKENQKYMFEIISISDDKDKNDALEVEKGMIATLREILTDENQDSKSLSAKIVGVVPEGILLKTLYGNFVITDQVYSEIGVDLIIQLVQGESEGNMFSPRLFGLENLIKKLEANNILMPKLIEKYGVSLSPKILFWIANLLRMNSTQTILEEISKIIPKENINGLTSENIGLFIKSLGEASNQIQSFLIPLIDNLPKDSWYQIQVPVDYIEQLSKQSLFFQKTSSGIVRVVSDVSLSEIGDVQLDVLIYLKQNNLRSIVNQIEVTIKHREDIEQGFFEQIKADFERIAGHFKLESNLVFLRDKDLTKFFTEESYSSSSETTSSDIII